MITVDVAKCTGCLLCALNCSLAWEGASNPFTARIRVKSPQNGPPEISFTDECNDCGLCTRVCLYDALTYGQP